MLKLTNNKNKKGVSVLIGYVLLVVFVVITSAIVFVWLKTYIPAESLNCPDSVSLFIKEYTLDCDANTLNLTMKNNGRFSYAGFFIHASNESGQEVATIDFSQYLRENNEIKKLGNSVAYIGDGDNPIKPGNESGAVFNFPSTLGNNLSVTLIPIRFQIENGRNRLVSCANAKLTQELQCGTESITPPEECVPEDIAVSCGLRVCGSAINNCGQGVTCPPNNCGGSTPVCDENGQCQAQVPGCGDGSISGTEACDDGNIVTGDGCSGTCTIETGYACSANPTPPPASQCNLLCRNGIINTESGEVCDGNSQSCTINGYSGTQTCNAQCTGWDTCTTTLFCGDGIITSPPESCDQGNGNIANGDGCSATCAIESGWACIGQPSQCFPPSLCNSNCVSSGFNAGSCTTPTSCTGTMPFSGNSYCGAGQGRCCCL